MSLSSGFFSNALDPLQRFAPDSQTLRSISSGLLLNLKRLQKLSSGLRLQHALVPFERVARIAPMFSNTLVHFERCARVSPILSTVAPFARALLLFFKDSNPFCVGFFKRSSTFGSVLLLLLEHSSFEPACSCFSNTRSPFERFAFFSQILFVRFERFAPVSEIRQSPSSDLHLFLKHASPFRAVCSCFPTNLSSLERFVLLFLQHSSPVRAVCS